MEPLRHIGKGARNASAPLRKNPVGIRLLAADQAAWAGRKTRPILEMPFSIWVRNSRMNDSVVIEPTSQFNQNTPNEPPPEIIDSRKASSALQPSTSARVSGASGMPIFLKT